MVAISKEEREAFLRRMGWSKDFPEAERKRIEDKWPDDNIEYALEMGG